MTVAYWERRCFTCRTTMNTCPEHALCRFNCQTTFFVQHTTLAYVWVQNITAVSNRMEQTWIYWFVPVEWNMAPFCRYILWLSPVVWIPVGGYHRDLPYADPRQELLGYCERNTGALEVCVCAGMATVSYIDLMRRYRCNDVSGTRQAFGSLLSLEDIKARWLNNEQNLEIYEQRIQIHF